MHEPLLDKLKHLPQQLMKTLKLQTIDDHHSLTFLYKNYKVHPSEVITIALLLFALLLLLLDGTSIIASIVCFLLPLAGCLKELVSHQSKKPYNFVQLNASEQNSRLTDEQFSQILSNNRNQYSTAKIYTTYFICYTLLEIATPLMVWLIGSVSWLLLRCCFTVAMLSRKATGITKLLGLLHIDHPDSPTRRNAQIYEKL